ncbi:hypothetical protein YC2023_098325 [Brassica napus]
MKQNHEMFQLLIINLYQLQIPHLKFILKSSSTIYLECELLRARRWDFQIYKSRKLIRNREHQWLLSLRQKPPLEGFMLAHKYDDTPSIELILALVAELKLARSEIGKLQETIGLWIVSLSQNKICERKMKSGNLIEVRCLPKVVIHADFLYFPGWIVRNRRN